MTPELIPWIQATAERARAAGELDLAAELERRLAPEPAAPEERDQTAESFGVPLTAPGEPHPEALRLEVLRLLGGDELVAHAANELLTSTGLYLDAAARALDAAGKLLKAAAEQWGRQQGGGP